MRKYVRDHTLYNIWTKEATLITVIYLNGSVLVNIDIFDFLMN